MDAGSQLRNIAYLSIGSNIDDREEHLKQAVKRIGDLELVSIDQVSSVYETEPVGYTEQEPFLNMAIKIRTDLSAESLLQKTQEIENSGGRKREIRWGPRTIDLDILLFNEENITLEQLTVPHPRMLERAFVLIPLQEIAPSIELSNGKPIEQYIEELTGKEGVHKWKSFCGEDVFGHFES
ncbi:2-amino-4-hydroxy-6-hydroxymethyldihydropteridine diphosphokinase [Evansella clarkii]|uniref:2-amino-4-hydroxy-6- hydroxymethyldihydropteridine diphosphokinase n=1 Tax=Evansella clarkii TaxID=79879 RepID=UPI0009988E14|nr:2-amino-4-hydroxy-6-hydroxymethyldihydropteridine diphosphokinase [Evansella clarkii]